jgi:hypothetical protein
MAHSELQGDLGHAESPTRSSSSSSSGLQTTGHQAVLPSPTARVIRLPFVLTRITTPTWPACGPRMILTRSNWLNVIMSVDPTRADWLDRKFVRSNPLIFGSPTRARTWDLRMLFWARPHSERRHLARRRDLERRRRCAGRFRHPGTAAHPRKNLRAPERRRSLRMSAAKTGFQAAAPRRKALGRGR